jgi:hypothetical protein
MKQDKEFLAQHNLMDYSLLFGVENNPAHNLQKQIDNNPEMMKRASQMLNQLNGLEGGGGKDQNFSSSTALVAVGSWSNQSSHVYLA